MRSGREDPDIRALRRRLGWTQSDLAEKLQVDQGTVSRWERGVESPRPATYSALRDLLMRADDRRILLRQLAIVRNNVSPACLVDSKHKLMEFSPKAEEHYLHRVGLSLKEHLGWNLERHAERVGNPQLWEAINRAGLGRVDIIFMRMVINIKGRGHLSQIEPIYQEGQFAGWFSTRLETFDYPTNDDISLELLDVLYADQPNRLTNVFTGTRGAPS